VILYQEQIPNIAIVEYVENLDVKLHADGYWNACTKEST